MADCVKCKYCDNHNEYKTNKRFDKIIDLLTGIENNTKNGGKNIDMDITIITLQEKIKELELAKQCWQTSSNTWEEAFKLLLAGGNQSGKLDKTPLKPKNANVEKYLAGEEYAEKYILSVYDKDMEAQLEAMEKGEIIGVQNAFFAGVASYLRQLAVEYVVGTLTKLLKENAIKLADWLLGQTEDVIIKGIYRLEPQDRALLINDMKQYSRFDELLKKLEANEQK